MKSYSVLLKKYICKNRLIIGVKIYAFCLNIWNSRMECYLTSGISRSRIYSLIYFLVRPSFNRTAAVSRTNNVDR